MAKKIELTEKITVNGHRFELTDYGDDDKFYECRGEVMWDDDHDQIPEPSLWRAAEKLEAILNRDGHKNTYVSHSEKGWVEVGILNK